MSKKRAVLAQLAETPEASNQDIVFLLGLKDIDISPGYVAVIRCEHRKRPAAPKDYLYSGESIYCASELLRHLGSERALTLCFAIGGRTEPQKSESSDLFSAQAVYLAAKLLRSLDSPERLAPLFIMMGGDE